LRILVVEDERKVASFIRQGLTEEGHTVEVALDGSTALDLILEGSPYDLVVLDLNLPRVDGFAILKAARARRVVTPVLVVSTTTGRLRVRGSSRIACSTSRPSTRGRFRSSSTIDGRSSGSRPACTPRANR